MQAIRTTTRHTANPEKGFFARIDAWLEERQLRATEAWLAESQNIGELETRLRSLKPGQPHPYY